MTDYSIVIPVYNEEDVIDQTVGELRKVLREAGVSYEIILVDDGSTDGTKIKLKGFESRFPGEIRTLTHAYNRGNGAAVRTGIESARGEIVACMDADGQHDPRDLPKLLLAAPECDMVVGARTRDYPGPWHRNLINRFYNAFASWVTQFPIEDLTSGFRLFRRKAILPYLNLFPLRFSYPTTSTLALIKAGHPIRYVPIQGRVRRGNRSKIRYLTDGPHFLMIMVKIMVLFEPLRVFIPVSGILFLLGLGTTFHSLWALKRLYIPNAAVMFFLVGIFVALLGLVAEQISQLAVPLWNPGVKKDD